MGIAHPLGGSAILETRPYRIYYYQQKSIAGLEKMEEPQQWHGKGASRIHANVGDECFEERRRESTHFAEGL